MNLHEYQAKALLKEFNVDVPLGFVCNNANDAIEIAKKIKNDTGCDVVAVKAQIHAGGRGKGGGVKIAKNDQEVFTYANQILGMNLVTHQTGPQGKLVRKIYIEQGIYYKGPSETKEFYLSILLNRNTGELVVIYSPEGGMDIEEVSAKSPEKIFKEPIDPHIGLSDFNARNIAFNLGLSGIAYKNFIPFIKALYHAYVNTDASMIEINPLVKTSDNKIFAADAKMILDDNALYRHPKYLELRDIFEEDPAEVEASEHNLNFVKLEGNVGCMVNGAGLAMATMDIIKLSGGEPANFLDVGGGANAKTVEAGFRIILKDKAVKAILVNIFGGIVRCDRVAEGIIEAYKNIGNISVPIVVRLQGTNAELAKEMIDRSGLKVLSAITLQEAADAVRAVLA
ncbi:MAG: ADP-forming succinate--CoA ligase subunit beta [Bacteroidales bacterium]|nr:ADP-forming succinate--CoA ligase subunit beta [Bacteroidales bacterium]